MSDWDDYYKSKVLDVEEWPWWKNVLFVVIVCLAVLLVVFLTCTGQRSSPHGGYAPDYEQDSSEQ